MAKKKSKKKEKFKKIKGYLNAKCDRCGKKRRLKFYNKEGEYVCENCGPKE
jgi:hypothetical protein